MEVSVSQIPRQTGCSPETRAKFELRSGGNTYSCVCVCVCVTGRVFIVLSASAKDSLFAEEGSIWAQIAGTTVQSVKTVTELKLVDMAEVRSKSRTCPTSTGRRSGQRHGRGRGRGSGKEGKGVEGTRKQKKGRTKSWGGGGKGGTETLAREIQRTEAGSP